MALEEAKNVFSAEEVEVEFVKGSETIRGYMLNVSVNQAKDVRRIFKIGSSTPELATGYTAVTGNASRLVLKDNSLTNFDWGSSGLGGAMEFDALKIILKKNTRIVATLVLDHVVLTADSVSLTAGDVAVMENVSFEAYRLKLE